MMFVVVAQICPSCGSHLWVRGPYANAAEAEAERLRWRESREHPAEMTCAELRVIECGGAHVEFDRT